MSERALWVHSDDREGLYMGCRMHIQRSCIPGRWVWQVWKQRGITGKPVVDGDASSQRAARRAAMKATREWVEKQK